MDALDQTQSDYLSAASDLEDTDGEAFTDGEAYTDNEDLDEAYPGQKAANPSRGSRVAGAALARSSEPASGRRSPSISSEHLSDPYSLRADPPLHVARRESYSPPHSAAEEEDRSHRSFTDSDFSALDAVEPTTPSDGPPDFIAPDPYTRHFAEEPSYAEGPESPQHASLSAIEGKLQQVNKTLVCFMSLKEQFTKTEQK